MNLVKPLVVICLLSLVGHLNAQSLKAYEKAIDEAVEKQEYSKALNGYKTLLDDADRGSTKMYYDAAQTARNYRVYDMAERYYWEVVKSEESADYPLSNYWLGMVQKILGKYTAADSSFQRFLSVNTAVDNEYQQKAEKEIADCAWALALEKDEIDLIRQDSTINTSCHTEVAPIFHEGQLYFSSVRYEMKDGEESENAFNQIFSSVEGQESVRLSDGFNKSGVNTGHTAFSPDGKRFFFTICEGEKAGNQRCHIYYKEKERNDNWGEAVRLSDEINLEAYTSTQPSVGLDAKGNELLFFTSDRPKERDGTDMDIWCSIRDANGEFGTPFNLKQVNTKEDDLTPYFHSASQYLYFSSNGRKNMGGFDIYKSRKDGNSWTEAEHLGAPVNSSYDDVYYSISNETGKAYLSSNRPATVCSKYPAGRTVCNDIYAYDLPNIDLIALTFNDITKDPLDECEITLIDLTSGERFPVATGTGNNRADYKLEFDHQYQVIGHRDQYKGDSSEVFTAVRGETGPLEKKLYLTPIVDLTTLTYNALDSSDLQGCTVQLFNVTLNKEDSIQLIPGLNKYHYPLEIGYEYRIRATKPGFSQATAEVSTIGVSTPRSYTRPLYLEPSMDQKKVVLFFDNDFPHPRSRRVTAAVDYESTFRDYMAKQGEFESALSDEPAEQQAVRRFFRDSVQAGFDNLSVFAASLLRYLQRDDATKVEVNIKGYASPRSGTDYNFRLTQRRVNCLENYFNSYKDGILQYYMRDDVGRLKITQVHQGEGKAIGGSEDLDDKVNSIYKVSASRERRVEIISVTIEEL